MTYVSWAVLYEGDTDAAYFNVLIPRLMEDLAVAGTKLPTIPTTPAIRLKRDGPRKVAEEACAASDAFFLVFIHADTGGRHQAKGLEQRGEAYCNEMRERCGWSSDRCIVIAPRHETEAWVLADADAVTATLGYNGTPNSIGLPATGDQAERLVDPKAVLQQAVAQVRGRRRPIELSQVFPAIAQRQDLGALRRVASFRRFEDSLRTALDDLGCL
jgi:hypothetical protein